VDSKGSKDSRRGTNPPSRANGQLQVRARVVALLARAAIEPAVLPNAGTTRHGCSTSSTCSSSPSRKQTASSTCSSNWTAMETGRSCGPSTSTRWCVLTAVSRASHCARLLMVCRRDVAYAGYRVHAVQPLHPGVPEHRGLGRRRHQLWRVDALRQHHLHVRAAGDAALHLFLCGLPARARAGRRGHGEACEGRRHQRRRRIHRRPHRAARSQDEAGQVGAHPRGGVREARRVNACAVLSHLAPAGPSACC
jgi:hypothetical protein